jgi:DNA excision repair protein ERCC-6
MMASNTCSSAHGGQVKRYSKAKKANVMVDQPQIIKNYNSFMGGVDLVDQQVALYRPTIKKKKWWFPVLTWGMAVQCHQAWRWFNLLQGTQMPYLKFLRSVVCETLRRHGSAKLKPGVKSYRPLLGAAAKSLRYSDIRHLPVVTTIMGVCQLESCKGRTTTRCDRCKVAVHPKCFNEYHTE